MKRKIGIFGGTFNPIHVGHAIIADAVMRNTDIDQLWLMVSPLNPFKEASHDIAPDYHRLRMAELVARRIDGVFASAFEFNLPKPSYTIDTLHALEEKFPDDEFHLVIGADNWTAFDRWRSHKEILERYHVLVYPRLGHDVIIPEALKERVRLVEAPVIEISSTEIRERIARGLGAGFRVIDTVEEYIDGCKLYQHNPQTDRPDYGQR